MKYILLGLFLLIGIPLLGIGLNILFFPVNTAEKMVKTAYDVQDKTLNADNAIYNYEWFKQQYEDIEAITKKYNNALETFSAFKKGLPSSRTEMSFEDKNEEARLRAVVDGLYNQKEQMIADYNARAKMANRNIFANSILPNYIDALTFITK